MSLSVDFESRSACDLRKAGIYRYAEDPTTEILCMAYAFGDEPVQLWLPGDPIPARIRQHIRAGGEMRAHNAQFERLMWRILAERFYFPTPALRQWRCTAAEAAAMGLPRALGRVASILRVPAEKDEAGHKVMLKLCKPRRIEKDGTIVWWDDPADFAILFAYCKRDVDAERGVAKRLRRLDASELAVYHLDQETNDRGVFIDQPLILAAQKIVDRAMREASEELESLTEGAVDAVTQVAKLTAWLNTQGVEVDNLRKDTVRELLKDDALAETVDRVLTLRQEAGKTSVGKLAAFLECVQRDGIVRGLLLYHAATTGRWAGQRVQVQNFPRPDINDIESYIPDVLAGRYAKLAASGRNPVTIVSSMLRSMICAKAGQRLLSGDYSQIEARIVCWIAGAEYGDNEYEKMAGVIYDRPWEEIKAAYKAGDVIATQQRTIGKNTVLGCGFGMGEDTYIEQAFKQSGIVVPPETAARAIAAYRTLKHQVETFWYEIEAAAMQAVRYPGTVVSVGLDGKIRYQVLGQFLWCILPSGRPLCYALPRIEMHTITTKKGKTFTKEGLTYTGLHMGAWGKRRTYGGHLTENVVQAMARDVMAEAMLRIDAAGYPLVMTVHDEIVADAPLDMGSLDHYLGLMKQRPAWATTCPIAVEGWEGDRYRK